MSEDPPEQGTTIRVVIADDHAVVRRGVRAILRGSEFEVVGEAADFGRLRELVIEERPDVAIVDLRMPGGDAGTEIKDLSTGARPVAVVVFTSASELSLAREAIRSGASGFVLKQSDAEELCAAVRAVASSRSYIDKNLEIVGNGTLSQRELETLRMLARGLKNEEVAAKLGVGVKTIEKYRARIRDKLGVSSPMGLVRAALKLGIVGSS